MSAWHWLRLDVILALHDEQLAEHGGRPGVRDQGLLESALGQPINLAAYGDPDVAALAASYAFGLAKNHPFIDGNKRAAWLAARTFLMLHGHDVGASDSEKVLKMLALAEGSLSEADFAAWLRGALTPIA